MARSHENEINLPYDAQRGSLHSKADPHWYVHYVCQSPGFTPPLQHDTVLCRGDYRRTDKVMKENWGSHYRLDHPPQISVDRSSLLCTYMTYGGGSLHTS